MGILEILRILVAVSTIGIGVWCLIRPRSISGFTGLDIPGPRGISEIRAIFGGLFIGMGAAPLIIPAIEAYRVLGICYAGIGAARLFSILFDKSYERSNIISVIS